jgi:two-component system OmpR family sensor kinase
MSAIDSSRAKRALAAGWLFFASINVYLTFVLAGEETIPYHLIWASYALLYGLYPWSKWVKWSAFWAVTLSTGWALIDHARSGFIGFSECSEILLMGLLVALLIWHVDRHRATQNRLIILQGDERRGAESRELTTRFGSHEARTRLTIIRGFVEVMAATTTEPATRQDAELVLDELDKTTVLIANLLTLVTVSDSAPPAPVDVDAVFQAVVHRWVATADREWRCSSATGVMWVNDERLEALLDCLIENAVKFTVPGDSIEIDCRTDGDDLVIDVSDSGAGIPEQDLDHVFDIFRTGSTAGDRAGSGLGLAIVHAIVEARHGTVAVASQEGVGTRFTLRFGVSVVPGTAPTHPRQLSTATDDEISADDLPLEPAQPAMVVPSVRSDELAPTPTCAAVATLL